MDCAAARQMMSARLDHETTRAEDDALDDHLGGCLRCRTWQNEAAHATRLLRIHPAEPIPDLAAAVMTQHDDRARRRLRWAQPLLALVAIVEIMMASPALLFRTTATVGDETPYIGSFGLAIAFGLLYIAWRPQRAAGLLPVVYALAVTMIVTAIVHLVVGRTQALGEAHHIVEVAGLILVWVLAGRPLPHLHRRRAPLSTVLPHSS